jgi:hypothetical protein
MACAERLKAGRLERGEGARVVNIYTRSTSASSTALTTATTLTTAFAATPSTTTTTTLATALTSATLTTGALLAGRLCGGGLEANVKDDSLGSCALLLLALILGLGSTHSGVLRAGNGIVLGLHASEIRLDLADLHLAEQGRIGLGAVALSQIFIKGVSGDLGLGLGLHDHDLDFSLLDRGVIGLDGGLLSLGSLRLGVTPVSSTGTSLGDLLTTASAASALVLAFAGRGLAILGLATSATASSAAATTIATTATLVRGNRSIVTGRRCSRLGSSSSASSRFLCTSSTALGSSSLGLVGCDLRSFLLVIRLEKREHVAHD